MTVSVTATHDAYRTLTATSAGTAPVAEAPIVVEEEPVMEGAPLLGETLPARDGRHGLARARPAPVQMVARRADR